MWMTTGLVRLPDGHGHDGLLHGFELAAAVGCHREIGLRQQPAIGAQHQKNHHAQREAPPGRCRTCNPFHGMVKMVRGTRLELVTPTVSR